MERVGQRVGDVADGPEAVAAATVTGYMRALARAAGQLASHGDTASVLAAVADSLVADFGAALALVWQLDPAEDVLVLRARSGLVPDAAEERARSRVPVASPRAKIAEVARTRRAYVAQTLADPAFEDPWFARQGIRAVAQVPLVVGERLHGVQVVFSREPIGDVLVEALHALAGSLSVRLERDRVAAELEAKREETARAARTAEERLRTVVSQATVTLFSFDAAGKITLATGRALESLGQTEAELVGKSVFELYADNPKVVEDSRRALAGEEVDTETDLGPVTFHAHMRPLRDKDGRVVGVVGVASDVTERRRAERALERERRDLAAILDSVPAMIWFKDDRNQALRVNRAASGSRGLTPEEYLRHTTEELYPDEAALYYQDDLEVIRSGVPKLGIIEPHLLGTGEKIWVRTDKIPHRDEAGNVKGVLVFATDITPLKRAEEALSAEKERLAVTLSSIGDGVVATDTEGRVVLLNRVAEELTGWTQDEARGRPLASVLRLADPRTGSPAPDPVAPILATGEATQGAGPLLFCEARSGKRRLVAERGAPIRRGGGALEGAVLVLRDMTEAKRLEDELLKVAKLESIGLLAAGIAHDFNNVLTAITANVSLAKLSLRPRDDAYELLGEVEGAALRARELTHQLLAFSKGGAPVKKPAALGALVRDSTSFALRGSNVRGDVAVASDLWPVEGDEGQLSQVLHNLVLNAQQAMPQGGVVSVRAENVVLEGRGVVPLPPGRYVRVSVEDRGRGIAPDDMPRIFDPFFTTKPGGSGLGLTTTFSIVKRHDGHVECRSRLGEGTRFDVWLPASPALVVSPRKKPEPLPQGKGRILVLDDEPRIRAVVGQILAHFGYESAFARDGQEAVDLYAQALEAGRRFDAAIMDLTIPGGMGGKEAMERILALDPTARGIVSSGYSNDPVMSEFAAHGFKGLIAKPYRLEDLGRVLAGVLEAEKR